MSIAVAITVWLVPRCRSQRAVLLPNSDRPFSGEDCPPQKQALDNDDHPTISRIEILLLGLFEVVPPHGPPATADGRAGTSFPVASLIFFFWGDFVWGSTGLGRYPLALVRFKFRLMLYSGLVKLKFWFKFKFMLTFGFDR